jgi:SAM-dependent methyltransferase
MLPEAYEALAGLENGHWWFVGERYVYRSLLELGAGKPHGGLRMLEVGCGSGGNLSLLGEYGPTTGLELSAQALELVPQRPALGLVQAQAGALPFAHDSFDGVHLLGVIEHLPDDQAALHEAGRVCRPGGMVTLLTSALPVLWSHHDEANLHQRRYLRGQLQDLLIRARLAPIRLTYQNFFVFLPTLVVRLWQRRGQGPPRYDMGTPPPWINRLLTLLVRLEAWLIRFMSLPIGVDLVAVCRVQKE